MKRTGAPLPARTMAIGSLPRPQRMGGIKAHVEGGKKSGGQAMRRGDGVEPMRGLVITSEGFRAWRKSAHIPSDAGQVRSDVHLGEWSADPFSDSSPQLSLLLPVIRTSHCRSSPTQARCNRGDYPTLQGTCHNLRAKDFTFVTRNLKEQIRRWSRYSLLHITANTVSTRWEAHNWTQGKTRGGMLPCVFVSKA